MTYTNHTQLTSERLRAVLSYDPVTGEFRRLVARQSRHIGKVAGTVCSGGYIQIKVDGRLYLAHRLAWLYVHGCWPAEDVDHINGRRGDNRIANLRDVAPAINNQNLHAARVCSATGLLGVSPNKRDGGFNAFIKVGRLSRNLGRFDTAEQAHEAYVSAKRQLHPGGML